MSIINAAPDKLLGIGMCMIKENNKYILKAKRKKIIKKLTVIFLLITIGMIILINKSDIFIIKKVAILGNPIISGEDVKERTQNLIGKNIFFISKRDIINEAKKNPYVEDVEISKAYPKQVNIKITEKQGIYYVDKVTYKCVLNNKLILLEKPDNIDNRNLVELRGINVDDVEPGSVVLENSRIENILEIFYKIIKNNPTNYKIDSIDISDLTNIKVYIGEVEGRLGNDENILDKMNKLLHIMASPEIGISKGYIDVGFEGSPVYYSE